MTNKRNCINTITNTIKLLTELLTSVHEENWDKAVDQLDSLKRKAVKIERLALAIPEENY